jgi:hypothetical protein
VSAILLRAGAELVTRRLRLGLSSSSGFNSGE